MKRNHKMITNGPFYSTLTNNAETPYSAELKVCIEEVVQNLLDKDTSASKPGMLLGKIQSIWDMGVRSTLLTGIIHK